MFRYLLVLLSLLAWVHGAAVCNSNVCKAPDCRCATTKAPGDLTSSEIPQFVMLTFDDAVENSNWMIYNELLYARKNPNGCPIEATFYMSHEYTDYSKVHNLWLNNHEIALRSVTNQISTTYWKNITLNQMIEEFSDERSIISHFANIPIDDVKGMRIPFLQLSGDVSFEAAKYIGLSYDSSWPTQTYRNPGLWPYTLDYQSGQDCSIGPCPTASIPGVWEVPMIDWTDQQNYVCSMVDGCIHAPTTTEELTEWYIDNFNIQYKGNRAPFGFFVRAGYFLTLEAHLEAYVKFLDYIQSLKDVYILGPSKIIEWIKNPVPLASMETTCRRVVDTGCTGASCRLYKGSEERYMSVCGNCPLVYPWLGNPLGTN